MIADEFLRTAMRSLPRELPSKILKANFSKHDSFTKNREIKLF